MNKVQLLFVFFLSVTFAGLALAQPTPQEEIPFEWLWINPEGESMTGYATKQEAVEAMHDSCEVCPELTKERFLGATEDTVTYEYHSKKVDPVPVDEWVYPRMEMHVPFITTPDFEVLFATGEQQETDFQSRYFDPLDSSCGDNYLDPYGPWKTLSPLSPGYNSNSLLNGIPAEFYEAYLPIPPDTRFADVERGYQSKQGFFQWLSEDDNQCYGPGDFTGGFTHYRFRALVCEEPYIEPFERKCILPEKALIIGYKNMDECEEGNPCHPSTGEKSEQVTDIVTGELVFTREYRSLTGYSNAGLGENWTHNFHQRTTGGLTTSEPVNLATGNGQQLRLSYSEVATQQLGEGVPVYISDDYPTMAVVSFTGTLPSGEPIIAEGYQLRKPDGVLETYNNDGWLTEIDSRGAITTLSYDDYGKLIEVRTDTGHSLSFAYNQDDNISTITTDNGTQYQYSYDSENNLTHVSYPTPAGVVDRQYHYEDAGFPNHLTGITDENGTRYSHYSYDTRGRTVVSEHAQTTNTVGQRRRTFDYQTSATVVTDASGEQWRYEFERNDGANNAIERKSLTDNKGFSQTFDANNNVTERIDAEGRITRFEYNANEQLTKRTLAADTPEEREITYEYLPPNLNLITAINSPSVSGTGNHRTEFTYDDDYNVTAITVNGFDLIGNPVTRSYAMSYNSRGKLTQLDGPRTDISDISTLSYYDCDTGGECGQLQSMTNELGHTTSFDSYSAEGRLTQLTDANGIVAQLSYHPRGWLETITQTPTVGTVRTTSYLYDAYGQLTQVTAPDGLQLTYIYDDAHDLRSITDNLGNKIEYTYDAKGNRNEHLAKDPDGSLARQTTLHFDRRNFVDQINQAGSIADIANDAIGNVNGYTDPNDNPSSSYQYDALNRLQQGIDALSNTTSYDYNVADDLIQVTAPNGAVTSYEYDDLGNRLKEVSPDRGTITYLYDDAGNVISQTDARGVTATFTYDALNRLTQASFPDASENISYVYDNCTNGIGRLCSSTHASGTSSYQYDPWGNVTQVTNVEIKDSNAIGTYVFQYSYDAANRVTQQINPNGLIIDYTRDAIGRVTDVTATWNGTVHNLLSNRQYRADGQYTQQTWGNGITETRQYDLQGRLFDQTLSGLGSIDFQYDANGNLTHKLSPALGDSTFGYDALNRVDSEVGAIGTWAFSYDANSNLLTQDDNGQSFSHTYNANSNQLIQAGPYTNTLDAAGNTTSDFSGGRNFTYNDRNQLSSYTDQQNTVTVGYQYNAFNLRTRKEVALTGTGSGNFVLNYQYDLNGQLNARYYEGFALLESYIWLDGEPIAKLHADPNTGDQKVLYLVTDHLMTPRLGLNETGQITWAWISDAYGRAAAIPDIDGDGNSEEVHLRFPGQYFDVESGLHYNWHRYYEPRIGRYITSDPIGLDGGLNTFGYALQNPLHYTDPLGLDVTINIHRTGSTSTSISGTINVTSNVTNQSFSGHTLENANPPNPNLPVPAGTYDAFLRTDHTPNRVELTGVPNATNVQIHNGNTAADVIGCFAAGTTVATDFVGNSVNAMNQIISIIKADGTGNITVNITGNP